MKKVLSVLLAVGILGGIGAMVDSIGILKEGECAPDFTANTDTGEKVSLADYRGKKNVVLFFYPKDFTAGCTRQACSFRDTYSEFASLNAVVFGVSPDDAASHATFSKRHRLPFALISDSTRVLSKAYGAERLGGLIGTQRRVTYVIDTKGIIRMAAHYELAIERHVPEALEALRALQD
jgi:peroxiredoxin Q/BCP